MKLFKIRQNNQNKLARLMQRIDEISEHLDTIADNNPDYSLVFNEIMLYLQEEDMSNCIFRKRRT